MYKIGEFSQIVGITTKTLRYYDAEGILPPAYRSAENGYRFYSVNGHLKTRIFGH